MADQVQAGGHRTAVASAPPRAASASRAVRPPRPAGLAAQQRRAGPTPALPSPAGRTASAAGIGRNGASPHGLKCTPTDRVQRWVAELQRAGGRGDHAAVGVLGRLDVGAGADAERRPEVDDEQRRRRRPAASTGRTAAHPPGSRGRRSARPAAVGALWTRTPATQHRRRAHPASASAAGVAWTIVFHRPRLIRMFNTLAGLLYPQRTRWSSRTSSWAPGANQPGHRTGGVAPPRRPHRVPRRWGQTSPSIQFLGIRTLVRQRATAPARSPAHRSEPSLSTSTRRCTFRAARCVVEGWGGRTIIPTSVSKPVRGHQANTVTPQSNRDARCRFGASAISRQGRRVGLVAIAQMHRALDLRISTAPRAGLLTA